MRTMRTLFLACLLGLFVTTPSEGASDIREQVDAEYGRLKLDAKHDKFNGSVFVTLGAVEEISGGDVMVFPTYFRGESGLAMYLIGVLAQLPSWAFLDGSIELLVDGVRMNLPSDGQPKRKVRDNGHVRESFSVAVDEDLLRKLAGASVIDVRFPGERRIDGELRPKHIAQFRKILEAPALVESKYPLPVAQAEPGSATQDSVAVEETD